MVPYSHKYSTLLPGLSSLLQPKNDFGKCSHKVYTVQFSKVLLYGDTDYGKNVAVVQAVSQFINDSERFRFLVPYLYFL